MRRRVGGEADGAVLWWHVHSQSLLSPLLLACLTAAVAGSMPPVALASAALRSRLCFRLLRSLPLSSCSCRPVSSKQSTISRTRAALQGKFVGIRENVLTYPNGLSLLRIGLTPVLSICILNHYYLTSLSVLLVAGVTDVLDGYIARTFPSQRSVLGSVLDPLADKLLIATLFLSLTKVSLIPGESLRRLF